MANAPWTYEVAPAGGETSGLEEYVVYDAAGEPVGKVTTVLRAPDGLYVVVDRGAPPVSHDRRAVRWEKVASVDHASLAVTLSAGAAELDDALELDPDKAVEPGTGEQHADAEAVRVTDLPEAQPATVPPGNVTGHADRQLLYGGSLAAGLLAVFLVLTGVILISAGAGGWSVIPFIAAGVLGSAALALVYALWRRPYEGPPER